MKANRQTSLIRAEIRKPAVIANYGWQSSQHCLSHWQAKTLSPCAVDITGCRFIQTIKRILRKVTVNVFNLGAIWKLLAQSGQLLSGFVVDVGKSFKNKTYIVLVRKGLKKSIQEDIHTFAWKGGTDMKELYALL